MNVAEAAKSLTPAQRAQVDSDFAAIYDVQYKKIRGHISLRLPGQKRHMADDITQETFMVLWRHMLLGRSVEKPYGLLRAIAMKRMASFFAVKSQNAMALDFEDPINKPIVAGHRYAAAEPGLAELTDDLSAAMSDMEKASSAWRKQHVRTCRVADEVTAGADHTRLELSRADESRTLAAFRAACDKVAEIRSELDAISPNWNSPTGMPASIASNGQQEGSFTSDYSRTHCDEGHELTLENILFTASGFRHCRTCRNGSGRCADAWVRARKRVDAELAGTPVDTWQPAVIEAWLNLHAAV